MFIPVFCLAVSAYFIHHSLNGKFGLHSHGEAVDRALELEFRLASLKTERDELQNRVVLLKNGSIERDMLDEQVRYNLNLLHPDEFVLSR